MSFSVARDERGRSGLCFDLSHRRSTTVSLETKNPSPFEEITSCWFLFRTKSVVSVTIATTLSEEQITVEGNDSTCDLNGKRYKWFVLICMNFIL